MAADGCRHFLILKEKTTGPASHRRLACPRRREFAAIIQQQHHTSPIPLHITFRESQSAPVQDGQVCRVCRALEPMRGDSPVQRSAQWQHQPCRHGKRPPRLAWSRLSEGQAYYDAPAHLERTHQPVYCPASPHPPAVAPTPRPRGLVVSAEAIPTSKRPFVSSTPLSKSVAPPRTAHRSRRPPSTRAFHHHLPTMYPISRPQCVCMSAPRLSQTSVPPSACP